MWGEKAQSQNVGNTTQTAVTGVISDQSCSKCWLHSSPPVLEQGSGSGSHHWASGVSRQLEHSSLTAALLRKCYIQTTAGKTEAHRRDF